MNTGQQIAPMPGNSFSMPDIEQKLPEARFIHLIRDGRDVSLSWRPLWFSPGNQFWLTIRRRAEVRRPPLLTQLLTTLKRIANLDLDIDPAMLVFRQVGSRIGEFAATQIRTRLRELDPWISSCVAEDPLLQHLRCWQNGNGDCDR